MTERNEAVRRLERILNSNFRSEETFRMNVEESTNQNIQQESITKTKKHKRQQNRTIKNNREQKKKGVRP